MKKISSDWIVTQKGLMIIKIILSPTMNMKAEQEGFPHQQLPMFIKETEKLLAYLKSLPEDKLKEIWGTSEKLARLNIERIRRMDLEKNLSPAILAFQGLQYQYLGGQVLSQDELDYLQEHLYIVSGFYGLLKPLDGVVPYRLEMKSTFSDWDYPSLADFWDSRLAKKIESETDFILNLASKEYSQTIIPHLEGQTQVVDFVFGEWIDGKVKQKATLLKMARGELVRYLARNEITALEEIKKFKGQGFVFNENQSDEKNFVFIKVKS